MVTICHQVSAACDRLPLHVERLLEEVFVLLRDLVLLAAILDLGYEIPDDAVGRRVENPLLVIEVLGPPERVLDVAGDILARNVEIRVRECVPRPLDERLSRYTVADESGHRLLDEFSYFTGLRIKPATGSGPVLVYLTLVTYV